MSQWKPISSAPNDASILVAYDDGSVDLILAKENDFDWQPYPSDVVAVRGIIRPKSWMPLPEPPK